MLALTATAPPSVIRMLIQSLCMDLNVKVINKNPNRENVFLDKRIRLPNQYGTTSYEQILEPIAQDLLQQREKYPMTIVYMGLKYCGFAYQLFNRILADSQFVGDDKEPSSRLFGQFHAPQTPHMKADILTEIKKKSSRLRVVFATTALGMGVNVPNVSKIIHIGPPSSLEAYMQEIGRAGRSGSKSCAIMYYNNSDIAKNKDIINDSIREYCTSKNVCLRKIILNYFGFESIQQKECCVICNGSSAVSSIKQTIPQRVRNLSDDCVELFYKEAKTIVDMCNAEHIGNIIDCNTVDSDMLVKQILDGISLIESERDLLQNYGIWNENCSGALFELISTYAPPIQR